MLVVCPLHALELLLLPNFGVICVKQRPNYSLSYFMHEFIHSIFTMQMSRLREAILESVCECEAIEAIPCSYSFISPPNHFQTNKIRWQWQSAEALIPLVVMHIIDSMDSCAHCSLLFAYGSECLNKKKRRNIIRP